MGQLAYNRQVTKLTDMSVKLYMPDELMALLGDRTKVSLHRVDDTSLSMGTGPYHFIGQDPSDRGRALVNVEVGLGKRMVFEVTFNFKALPLLAKEAHKSPKL